MYQAPLKETELKMAKKSFTSAPRRGIDSFEINGTTFRYKLDVPGAVVMDYMAEADEENPTKMVGVVNDLLAGTLIEEDLDRFNEFIRKEENNVDLVMLMDICGWLIEELSGKDQPLSGFGAGS